MEALRKALEHILKDFGSKYQILLPKYVCKKEGMGSAWRDKAGSLFTPEKHEAVTSRGMVAANHPLAAAAGLEMLGMGGNAIDAAVATVFALTVVEPMMVSIFGAGFVNFYEASTGNIVIVDNYTVAPAAA